MAQPLVITGTVEKYDIVAYTSGGGTTGQAGAIRHALSRALSEADRENYRPPLKAAGCRWSNNKKLWYWRHEEDGRSWSRGKKTMSQIRSKYGSQVFRGGAETTGFEQIAGATA